MNMFFLLFFASLFYIHPFKNFSLREYLGKKRISRIWFKKIDENNTKDGYDHRYSREEVVNATQINTFSKNLNKLYLLKLLTDKTTSTFTKIHILNNICKYEYDLTAGRLLNDDFLLFMME